MTTTTPWAHLPNAVHINRVIASAKANPDHWAAAWDVVRNAAWDVVRNAAWAEAWSTVQDAGRTAEYNAAWATAVRESVRDAIIALIAYDDCAYMLDSDPGELAILAKFGDPRAILLLPACKAFHSLKELV